MGSLSSSAALSFFASFAAHAGDAVEAQGFLDDGLVVLPCEHDSFSFAR